MYILGYNTAICGHDRGETLLDKFVWMLEHIEVLKEVLISSLNEMYTNRGARADANNKPVVKAVHNKGLIEGRTGVANQLTPFQHKPSLDNKTSSTLLRGMNASV